MYVYSDGGGSPCPRIPLGRGSLPRCPRGRRLRCGGWQHSSPGSQSPETEEDGKGEQREEEVIQTRQEILKVTKHPSLQSHDSLINATNKHNIQGQKC